MSNARNLADLLDSTGDVKSTALDNVPASDDASALTTGTLPDGRFPATLPAISGAALTGVQPFPTGTKMVFAQASAPTGWTQDTANNDKALRVVSGAGGGTGGTHALTSPPSTSHSHTGPSHTHTGASHTHSTPSHSHSHSLSAGAHTLSLAQMPSHNHALTLYYWGGQGSGTPMTAGSPQNPSTANTNVKGSSHSHSHSLSGSITSGGSGTSGAGGTGATGSGGTGNTSSAGPTAFAPQYVDVIVATKD